MRVALIAPSAVPVPPPAYGGTELFVAELAEALVALGHDVTVFATGDSRPAGRLRACLADARWPPDAAREAEHVRFAWRTIAHEGFDVVHANAPEALSAPEASRVPLVVTVHHARIERLVAAYAAAPRAALVAVSRRQAELHPELAFARVIHHGLDPSRFDAGEGRGGYVAFLGRIGPEKAPHVAIDAARRAGVPIRVAGPCWSGDPFYDGYFAHEIRPRLAQPDVTWIGEVDQSDKRALLAEARALLVPLGWEEPFGLVLVEAMLSGTPVVAFACGAAPEIVDEGVTGFLVHDAAEMADRIARIGRIDRRRCRARAEERWSARRMAKEYVELYAELVTSSRAAPRRAS